jgi:hypothetical protein
MVGGSLTMNDRRGEKLGWTLGLLGGTAWMFILAAWAFFAGDWRIGAFALGAGLCVVGLVAQLAPWKHPTTRFWKLFLPPVAVMILAAGVLMVWAGRGLSTLEWAPALLVGVFVWFLTGIGWRRWDDGNPGRKVIPAETELS